MTMEVRTILELIQMFTVYSLCVLLFPYIVFYHYLKEKSLAEKFIICVIIGNFYIMNVVFAMFLLHIPSRPMLYIISVGPAVFAWRQINQPPIKRFFVVLYTGLSRLFLGEAKIKTIATLLFHRPKKAIGNIIRGILSHIAHHFIEWVLLTGLISFDIWYYSYQTVRNYAYGAPDMVIHHYWVNQMSAGNIFCAGIYPFGFHNVIYFIHTFFDIPVLTIMRVFGVVQTTFIYLMLYVLLRKICHSKYIPFLGVFIFTLPNLFGVLSNMRYQCTIPQEYAMLFLYPCAYFLIQFFERKKLEIQTEAELRREKKLYAWLEQYHILPSTRSLTFFAMSFSMTLAVHFYITIVAILLCIAVAIAYFPIVFKARYFWAITLAGILSLTSAIAPMGIAYMQGTPLEGSLRWALSVITPASSGESTENTTENNDVEKTPQPESNLENTEEDSSSENSSFKADISKDNISEKNTFLSRLTNTVSTKGRAMLFTIKTSFRKLHTKVKSFNNIIIECLYTAYNGEEFSTLIIWLTEGIIVLSILFIFVRKKFYYRNILSIGLYLFLLFLMAGGGRLHLPSLMDWGRCSIFLAYAAPLICTCAADIVYVVICRPFRYHRFTEILPIGLTCALTILTINYNFIKPLSIVYTVQPRGEVACNYEIMENYPEKTWTIVATTSSLHIIMDKGWHMELCTFLNGMQDYTADSRVIIPTKHVFFYIEKIPLAYGVAAPVDSPPANTGSVSKENAEKPVSFGGGNVYGLENRNALESRMYYWAQAFQKKYPQEFQVYYEDESFICYHIVQNEYSLFNFAIDYGYNK